MSQFNKSSLEGMYMYCDAQGIKTCCTVKEAYKQIALVLNMALTVGCCFVFGYFAAYYSSLATDMVSINTCTNTGNVCLF